MVSGDDLNTTSNVAFGSEESTSDDEFVSTPTVHDDSQSSQDSSKSQQHQIPSKHIKNDQASYYLSTAEGSYEFELNQNSKTWVSTSGFFDISQSFIKFRNKCVSRAEDDLKQLDEYEDLSLGGIIVMDDKIHNDRYLPMEEIQQLLLQDIDAINYFAVKQLEDEEARVCDRFARRMKSKVADADQVENDVDHWCRSVPDYGADTKRLRDAVCELHSTNSGEYFICTYTFVNKAATLVRDTFDMLGKQYIKSSTFMKCTGANSIIFASSERLTKSNPSLVNHGKR